MNKEIKQGDIFNAGGIHYAEDYKPHYTNRSIMNTVTVNKKELVKVLTENRDVHQKEYEEAAEGYKIVVIKALKKKLKRVEAGKKFDMYFSNVGNKPENHTQDYQNVIDMLGVAEQESIDISMDDYLKYYKNNWSWHGSWHLSNKMYVDAYYASASEAQ